MQYLALLSVLASTPVVFAQSPANDTAADATLGTNTTSTILTPINGTAVNAAALSSICQIPDGSYCDGASASLIYYCDSGVATPSECPDDLGDTSATCFSPTSTPGDAYCMLPDGVMPPVQDTASTDPTTSDDSAAPTQQDSSASTVQDAPSSATSAPAGAQPDGPTILSPDATKNETVVNHNVQIPASAPGASSAHPGPPDTSASAPKSKPDAYMPPFPACGGPPASPAAPPAHPEGPPHPEAPSGHPGAPPTHSEAPPAHPQPSSEGSRGGPPSGGPPAAGPPSAGPPAGAPSSGEHHGPPSGPPHQPSGVAGPSGWKGKPEGVAMPSGMHMPPSGGFAHPSGGMGRPEGSKPSGPPGGHEGGPPAAAAPTSVPMIPDSKPAGAAPSAARSSTFYKMPSPTITAAPSSANEFSPTFTGAANSMTTSGREVTVLACFAAMLASLF